MIKLPRFELPMPIMTALIRSGVLGAVLAWALLQNVRLTEKLFSIIENNTAALHSIKSESCAEMCREANAEIVR